MCVCVCLQEDSTPDYLAKAEERIRDEEERVNSYLHVTSKPKLLKEVCVVGVGGGGGGIGAGGRCLAAPLALPLRPHTPPTPLTHPHYHTHT